MLWWGRPSLIFLKSLATRDAKGLYIVPFAMGQIEFRNWFESSMYRQGGGGVGLMYVSVGLSSIFPDEWIGSEVVLCILKCLDSVSLLTNLFRSTKS